MAAARPAACSLCLARRYAPHPARRPALPQHGRRKHHPAAPPRPRLRCPQEVLRGYTGDRSARPVFAGPSNLFDVLGQGYQRPLELATLRLFNMNLVLGHCERAAPPPSPQPPPPHPPPAAAPCALVCCPPAGVPAS